jgi:hypothetical protein
VQFARHAHRTIRDRDLGGYFGIDFMMLAGLGSDIVRLWARPRRRGSRIDLNFATGKSTKAGTAGSSNGLPS